MLKFILGRAGSGKTRYIQDKMIENARDGKEKLMLIVPKQCSFEIEKRILELAGPVYADKILVYSFSRLAEAVSREEGGIVGTRLTGAGRRVLMNMAIEACEDSIEMYKSSAGSGAMTDIMLAAVDEMKMCCISPDKLLETSGHLKGRDIGLEKKLREISLIYGTYNALVGSSYLDSRDDLTRLAEVLEQSDFFDGYTVAVDSFGSFSAQEMAVLRMIMRRAGSVTLALCADLQDKQDVGIFALTNRTYSSIKRMAQQDGIEVLPDLLLKENKRFINTSLSVVERNIFASAGGLERCSGEGEGIHIYEAADIFEEADYVSAQIRHLVAHEGYKYSDIAIICADETQYSGNLDVKLESRGIPCFISAPVKVDAEPLMRFALGAFEAARSLDSEVILDMLKTGISGISESDIAELENYIFTWKINASQWKNEFTKHPDGFSPVMSDNEIIRLENINKTRKKMIMPIMSFAEKTKDASGAEICEAVYEFLTKFNIDQNIPLYCKFLENEGEGELGRKQIRIWELLMELLEQMYAILGDRRVEREWFHRLLRDIISSQDISDIPQVLDQVIFGTHDQIRSLDARAVFLIGAIHEKLPRVVSSDGVFSDIERRRLIEIELPLNDGVKNRTVKERYLCYCAACLARERLFMTYYTSSGKEEKIPSELIAEIRNIFPKLRIVKEMDAEYFANTKKAAFSVLAKNLSENNQIAKNLEMVFEGDEEYELKIEALKRIADFGNFGMENKALASIIFKSSGVLSASRIEVYHQCKFKYFCRYTLRAKERRPAEVDFMQYGTIMHFIFEKVFALGTIGEDIDTLREEIRKMCKAYADENMGGFDALAAREKYRLDRICAGAADLVEHMKREAEQSEFTAQAFELKLGESEKYPPLKIKTPMGNTVEIGGIIDRVDIYEGTDGKYVRVVDYKTGNKEFKLVDVLYGLNMQMLVYLTALAQSGNEIPAGILYMPSSSPVISADHSFSESKIISEREKKLRMNGLILEDKDIIKAMENAARGRFIKAKIQGDEVVKSDGVIGKEALCEVMEYVKRLIALMADGICMGEINARPNLKNTLPCTYCEYKAICEREYDEEDIETQSCGNDDVIRHMREDKANE